MGLSHDRYEVHHHGGGVSPHPAYGYVNQRAVEAGATRLSRRWRTVMSDDNPVRSTPTPTAYHQGCCPVSRIPASSTTATRWALPTAKDRA